LNRGVGLFARLPAMPVTAEAAETYEGVVLDIPERSEFVRSPGDVLALSIAVAVSVLGILLAEFFQDALIGFEQDLLLLVDRTPDTVEVLFVGLVQIVALVAPIVLVGVLLVRRKVVRLGVIALGAALGGLATWGIDHFVIDRARPSVFQDAVAFESWVTGAAFPNSPYIAAATAAMVVAGPWLTRRWRRTGWAMIWLFVLLRVIAGVNLPVDLIIALGVGWAAGALVRLIFGAPNRSATGPEIIDALRLSAVEPTRLWAASVDARGSTPYFAETAPGGRLFVKVLSPDERSADLLFRGYRRVRLKNVGDERAFSSLRRTVEHEALLALAASAEGVRTPRLVAVAQAGPDSMLLAYELIKGSSLDSVPADNITDEVLAGIWEQVGMLRRTRTAHRDLRLANVFIDPNANPWIIDFGFSELASTDRMLNNDVAQLVVSSSLKVGPERAVAAAAAGLGTQAVCDAAPRMQPLALSGATATALKGTDVLERVHDSVADLCGAEAIELEPVERVKPKTIITIAALFAAIYVLIPQLVDVDFATVADANWWWVLVGALFSLLTYVGSAASLAGSVPEHLPAWTTFEAQMASSFANRVTPAKVGGVATNLRFLQKAGLETPVAAAGVGISSVAGFVVHLVMLLVFVAWTSNTAVSTFHLPSASTVAVVLTVVFLVAALVFVVPWVRRVFMKRVWPMVQQAAGGVWTVVRSPSRIAMVFGGSLLTTWAYIFALYASVEAFGGGLGFAAVGVAFLAGSAAAQVAPTPGGVGAAEVAFIAVLTAFGLPAKIATPAVFLYRIVTFWLPVIPGWLAFHDMERKGAL